jgi:hypothetical protein
MSQHEPNTLRSTLDDAGAVHARMDAIRLKHMLDPGSLTEREWMCIQFDEHGFGCGPCRTVRASDPNI